MAIQYLSKAKYSIIFLLILTFYKVKSEVPNLEDIESIKEITLSNFDDTYLKYKNMVVAYYNSDSDWETLNLEPKLTALAKNLSEFDPPIYLAKCKLTKEIKSSKNTPITLNFNLKLNFVFYTDLLDIIRYGLETEDEVTNLDTESIFKFVSYFYVQPVSTLKELDRIIRKPNILTIIYFSDDFKSQKAQGFKLVARNSLFWNKNFKFVLADSELAESLKSEAGDILIKKKVDEKEVRLTEGFDDNILIKTILLHEKELYNSEEITQEAIKANIPLLTLFRKVNHPKTKYYEDIFRQAFLSIKQSNPNIDQILVPIIIGNEEEVDLDIGELARISPSNEEVKVALLDIRSPNDKDWRRYYLENDINEPNILEFVSNFFKGKLKPNFRSEEINPDYPTGLGKMNYIVGSTFDQQVIENPLDVIVVFHTEHCKHCETFISNFIYFWEDYQETNPTLYFGVFDALKNDNAYIVPDGYPEIHLFKRGAKDTPIFFDGIKDYEGLETFLKAQVGLKPKKPTNPFSTSSTSSASSASSTSSQAKKDEI